MKLGFLLTFLQLFHTAVNGQGGLRFPTENKLDEDNPLQLINDSVGRDRHELQIKSHHHEKGKLQARHLAETQTCGDGACSSGESTTNCPEDCANLELVASENGVRGAPGVIFFVKAKRDISIHSFDIYSGTKAENERVKVYTRRGKYSGFELSEDGWNLVHNNRVNLLGGQVPTSLGELDTSVTIPAGTIQSFFIWVPNNRIRYFAGSSQDAVFSSNSELTFFEGVGATSKFSGPYDEHFHSPRVFRGVIRYDAVSLTQGSDPLSLGIPRESRIFCLGSQRSVRFTVNTDDYGFETAWQFQKKGQSDPIFQGPDSGNYKSSSLYEGTVCVDIGMYEFIITDLMKDGLCCTTGNGFYSIEVRDENGIWKEAVRGGDFEGSKKHTIDVGETESAMTDRDKEYLKAHNTRRLDWHSRYNKEYRPLKWSNGLKANSMIYAVKLLDTCQTETPKHAPNNPYGENLARNQGSGFWGQLYDPDKIVGRFIDREEGLPWPQNGHLTNALWRPTSYVGCAEAGKSYEVINSRGQPATHTCNVQVCRYSKPGNCGMANFRDEKGTMDWETAMLQDESTCKPDCPPEGCFDE